MTWQRVFNNPAPAVVPMATAKKGDRVAIWYRGQPATGVVFRVKKDGTKSVRLVDDDEDPVWFDYPPGWVFENPARENPKASAGVEAAVKAWQMYYGADGLPIKTQQRFYAKARKLTDKVATHHGMSVQSAHDQVTAEASRRGKIWPRPGKDY